MIRLKNILVPVDFSRPSEHAFAYGLSLATRFHAHLTVAHVVPSLAVFNHASPLVEVDLDKLAMDSARQGLRDFVLSRNRGGAMDPLRIHTVLKTGDVRTELLRIIDDEKIDLVALGTHGRRTFERFILGSTTEHLLRKVPVPILTVPLMDMDGNTGNGDFIPIRRIVYATDLSANSEVGLRYAADVARTFGATLTLLHAMDPLEAGQWFVSVPGAIQFDIGAIRESAMDQLRKAMDSEHTEDTRAEAVVLEGTPHRTITQFVQETKADLLILNLQSKGILERAMLGATAERVIRSSHIPVLSIPVDTAARFLQASSAA